jgi:hypothetical protein
MTPFQSLSLAQPATHWVHHYSHPVTESLSAIQSVHHYSPSIRVTVIQKLSQCILIPIQSLSYCQPASQFIMTLFNHWVTVSQPRTQSVHHDSNSLAELMPASHSIIHCTMTPIQSHSHCQRATHSFYNYSNSVTESLPASNSFIQCTMTPIHWVTVSQLLSSLWPHSVTESPSANHALSQCTMTPIHSLSYCQPASHSIIQCIMTPIQSPSHSQSAAQSMLQSYILSLPILTSILD